MMKLSKQSSEELIMTALKQSNKKILIHTKLIKKLTGRIEEIEESVKERENEIDDIFRILDAT